MLRATYRDITDLINCKADFKGNSAKAINNNGVYNVFSYNTLIYSIDNTGKIYFNNVYYSVTTSKLQNIICRLLNLKSKRA